MYHKVIYKCIRLWMLNLTFKKIHHVYYPLLQINKIPLSNVLDANQININMSIIIDKHYNVI